MVHQRDRLPYWDGFFSVFGGFNLTHNHEEANMRIFFSIGGFIVNFGIMMFMERSFSFANYM